jgi:hypothetical protein
LPTRPILLTYSSIESGWNKIKCSMKKVVR